MDNDADTTEPVLHTGPKSYVEREVEDVRADTRGSAHLPGCESDVPFAGSDGGEGLFRLGRRGFIGVAGGLALGAVPSAADGTDSSETSVGTTEGEGSNDASESTEDPSADEDTADERPWVVEQAGECLEITPLAGGAPPTEFYELEREGIGGDEPMRALQEAGTSVLFLYRDDAGDVYLVVVHGKQEATEDGAGGSASFAFEDLPDDGDWVVQDDSYSGPTRFDVWNVDSEPQTVHWTWQSGWKDGGVYGPLAGDDVSFAVQPMFNEEAELYGEHYEGEVESWQLLSGALDDPVRSGLDMEEPVRLRTGRCRAEPAAELIEGFEDGTTDAYVASSDGSEWSVADSAAYQDAYGLDFNGGTAEQLVSMPDFATPLPRYLRRGETFEIYMRNVAEDGDFVSTRFEWAIGDGPAEADAGGFSSGDVTDNYLIDMEGDQVQSTGKYQLQYNSPGSDGTDVDAEMDMTWEVGTWYKHVVDFGDSVTEEITTTAYEPDGSGGWQVATNQSGADAALSITETSRDSGGICFQSSGRRSQWDSLRVIDTG